MDVTPKAVSPAQGAIMCNVSRTKFYELLNKQIPARKIGRRTIVLVSDIERFLNELPAAA